MTNKGLEREKRSRPFDKANKSLELCDEGHTYYARACVGANDSPQVALVNINSLKFRFEDLNQFFHLVISIRITKGYTVT